jgi:succinyl-diaminopimelate desuccinylase
MIEVSDISAQLDKDRLLERLATMVKIPSENPPGEEAEVAAWAAAMCDELGFEVKTYEAEPNRPNVVARLTRGDGPTVCFCSHYDVVPAGDPALWADPPYSATVRDGHLIGRGSSDAKGPIAAAFEAVEIIHSLGSTFEGTLEFALVADEEAMGFKGAGYLVSEGIVKPDSAIVGEPTRLRIVRGQRGPCWMRIFTRGVAGHGSAPERGVNAIKHMAEIVLHLEETLPDIDHPLLGRPTINVGTIRGGEKVNVIPAGCLAEVDRRSVPGETRESVIESVEQAVEIARKTFPDINATVELPYFGDPFEISEDSTIVQECVAAVTDVTGVQAEIVGFRGSSDARFLFEAGAEVIVCGPGEIKVAHTARESIEIAELEQGAIAYAAVFARLLSMST